jgi:hypothetical protein
MSTYRNTATGEIRDLDDALIASWQAAGNPKAAQWEPFTPPPEPLPAPTPDWAPFRGGLLISPDVAALMGAARVAGCEPAVTALPVALEKAQSGNMGDFAACWALVARDGTASPELIAQLVATAEACNLPEAFVAALQPIATPEPVRARNPDGTFIADDPSTLENEAWVTP